MKKIAFTLSEVLITLGIIGVVAAVTLPTVINKIQDRQFRVKAKKAYSLTGQVIEKMKNNDEYNFPITYTDYSTISSEINKQSSEFNNNFKKYFNGAKYISVSSYKYKLLGSDVNSFPVSIITYSGFNTNDGMTYMIGSNASYFSKYTVICVDVNGIKNKPNQFGRDCFMFGINHNTGKLTPSVIGFCDRKNTNITNGMGCMQYILLNKDY